MYGSESDFLVYCVRFCSPVRLLEVCVLIVLSKFFSKLKIVVRAGKQSSWTGGSIFYKIYPSPSLRAGRMGQNKHFVALSVTA